ncbi:MAG: peptidylprolyl isomerase [Candidatus Binatia bacterium]
MTTRARWLREPLVHFAALGAALFALHRAVAPPPATRRIEVTRAVVEGLRRDHARRTGAPPTPTEEAALVDRWVDGEVMVREALALGLDRGDIIVRRRLLQKMEFLNEGAEPVPAPTDAELEAWLAAHPGAHAVPDRVSLTHVFVSTERHGAAAEAAAAALRARVVAGEDAAGLGDPFLRGREFPLYTETELAGVFGPALATAVLRLEPGTWSAPLHSSYGLHLVRVTERRPGRRPALAEVREAVARDWQAAQRDTGARAALARLRASYDIHVEASP